MQKILIALFFTTSLLASTSDRWVSIVCEPVTVRNEQNESLTIEFKEKQTCPGIHNEMEMLAIVYTENQFRTFSYIMTKTKLISEDVEYAAGVYGAEIEAYDYTSQELNLKNKKVYTICREYIDEMNFGKCFNNN